MGLLIFLEDTDVLSEKVMKQNVDTIFCSQRIVSFNIFGPKIFEIIHTNTVMTDNICIDFFTTNACTLSHEIYIKQFSSLTKETTTQNSIYADSINVTPISNNNISIIFESILKPPTHYICRDTRINNSIFEATCVSDKFTEHNISFVEAFWLAVSSSIIKETCLENDIFANACISEKLFSNNINNLFENISKNNAFISNIKIHSQDIFANACISEKLFSNNSVLIAENILRISSYYVGNVTVAVNKIFADVTTTEPVISNNMAADFPKRLSYKYLKGIQQEKFLNTTIITEHIVKHNKCSILFNDTDSIIHNSISSHNIDNETAEASLLSNEVIIKASGGDITENFHEMTLTTDKDSYCWTLVLTTWSSKIYVACSVFSEISVSFPGFPESIFIVDDRRMIRTANNDGSILQEYTITARSKTSLLGDWSANVNNTWESTTAYDILQEIADSANVSINYSDMPNWTISELSVDGLLPVAIMQKITNACGCFLTTVQDTLYIKKKYDIAPVLWSEDFVPFQRDIQNLDTCLAITDYINIGDNYTEVIVSDYQDSSAFNIRLVLVETLSDTEAIVKLVSNPILAPDVVQQIIKTSHLPDGVYLSYMGEFLDEIKETIEIINGKGNTTEALYAINSFDYGRNVDLGVLTIDASGGIVSEKPLTSLVTVTYLTHLHKITVTSNDTKVQLYTEI